MLRQIPDSRSHARIILQFYAADSVADRVIVRFIKPLDVHDLETLMPAMNNSCQAQRLANWQLAMFGLLCDSTWNLQLDRVNSYTQINTLHINHSD